MSEIVVVSELMWPFVVIGDSEAESVSVVSREEVVTETAESVVVLDPTPTIA